MRAGDIARDAKKEESMTVSQIGIIITIFLVILTVVLIWDEIRAEQSFRVWRAENEHKQKKAGQ